MVAKCTSDWLL